MTPLFRSSRRTKRGLLITLGCCVCIFIAAAPLLAALFYVKDPQVITILPIGDSITVGFLSEDGNGYRLSLSKALAKAGFSAFTCDIPSDSSTSDGERGCRPPIGWRRAHRFVGSQSSGDMDSNRHEGYNGFSISQIRAISAPVLESYCGTSTSSSQGLAARPWDKPDVVLLMAGTNDEVRNPLGEDTTAAPRRLQGLIDFVGTTCPHAAVIVAQIVPSNDSMSAGVVGGAVRVAAFNALLPGIVQDLSRRGRNVSLVDMDDTVEGTDLVDGVHPDHAAYHRMGDVWWRGLQAALPMLGGHTSGAMTDTGKEEDDLL